MLTGIRCWKSAFDAEIISASQEPYSASKAGDKQTLLRRSLKRAFDVIGAAILLALAAPIIFLVTIAIALEGRPIFFGHQRVGRGNRTFSCLKFRTMVPNAEEKLAALLQADPVLAAEWSATQKLRLDPRVTAIGRILRAYSLDELAQLVNVIRGDMSLVGPRPVTAGELDRYYGAAAAEYAAVRPGLTGLWQVSGRSDASFARRVALDTSYVRNFGFRNDLRILLATPAAVLLRRGAC
ncbi:sugar transferase [Belnapia sp. T18]|uniref:Sugar transferase n=1 Tax=Belnapia arida TaxID=2804533 RepID=A0ABS1UAX8_9PROT|nr:sugar transferase [Belnapia arida]MBL6081084.1 sugar transferase [Belnapia arida]